MLVKSKNILFGVLHLVMLLLMVHWFIISVVYLKDISWLALIAGGFVFLLGYFGRFSITRAFNWLMKHKNGLMLGAILVQVIFMLSAELFIRRDAAVVYTGAFGLLKETSISSYLTRNPNNLPLFLYERFFYQIFGGAGLWIMQILNMVYVNAGAVVLYRLGLKHYDQKVADWVYTLYLVLICYSPYFYSMYTDIPPLPLIALQLGLALDILKSKSSSSQEKTSLWLGLLSGITMLIRPTTIIVVLAFWMVLFFKGQWKVFGKVFALTALSTGLVFGALNTAVKHQTVVPILKGEGLAKGPLLFINLGLTNIGHNQEDMKEGLLQYVDEDKRDEYNNGMFKNEYIIKEIKRRLKNYGPLGLIGHVYYKQSLTVAEGTLGWLYRDVEHEKTPVINPLYESYTKDLPPAKWVRTYFLSTDRPQYRYYEFVKQLVWIVMAVGLVIVYLKKREEDDIHFLSLAVFGGLLFLIIFEGGKTRYLIQFLPQILLLASIGLADRPKKWLLASKGSSDPHI
ncbi:glycosyltransferase family 39 protein [Streptococcus australis]|uniref:glycosyltransferase family 39 protein n=1 Tax=Streptococcus australis TaxID=113107 RepID=UPI001CC10792|nr:glycosyltransferase family 39 protein [Streptococcus australis]MBZ2159426.1 glycosyltransferase family 39 protein [Streptococcus australis]